VYPACAEITGSCAARRCFIVAAAASPRASASARRWLFASPRAIASSSVNAMAAGCALAIHGEINPKAAATIARFMM
jgi:hypothetical protein